jgi:hypothetical protein
MAIVLLMFITTPSEINDLVEVSSTQHQEY